MAGRTTLRGTANQKNPPRTKSRNMLGQGQFSIYLPRRADAEYYVRSPVKVKAEMLLSPEHLGGRSVGSIPCRARAEKLTRENGLSVVNVPIKIEAELLLTPGMAFSCKPATPQSPTPQDIHEASLQETKPLQVAESWELWGKKMKAALSKYRSQYGVKSENLWQTKQVLVSELRLDNNSARTRELTKRINSYADQVFEQNKRIRLLQARLREEEGGRAESSEKVNVVEQQYRLLEKRLKTAESRAMGAEHQAEAIKLRTRDLGVVCGHQGVQLKELARQVDLFAKILATQKIAAVDTYKALEQQLATQSVFEKEPLSSGDDTTSGCNTGSDSSLMRISNSRSFKVHTPIAEVNTQPLLHRKNISSELENQHLLLPCNSRIRSFRDHLLTRPRSEPRPNSELSESEEIVSGNHLGFLLNQLIHFAPNWNVEFASSMKRAEELIDYCSVQASKLKDLSAELDCLGTKTKRERRSSPRIFLFEPQAYEIRSDSVESSPFRERPSSKVSGPQKATVASGLADATDSIEVSVMDGTSKATLSSEPKKSSVDEPILHKFTVIARAKPTEGSANEKVLTERSTQTLPMTLRLLPTFGSEKEKDTRNCTRLSTSPSHSYAQIGRQAALRRALSPLRYELQMWRLAGRTLIQASLLWFGIRLLPQMQLFRFIPPAT